MNYLKMSFYFNLINNYKSYMAYINNKLKALFLHNVKCGGSYVRKILIDHYSFEGFFIESLTDCDISNNNKMDNCKYLILNQYKGIKKYEDFFIFTFVRNPYDKIYSAYKYLKQKIKDGNFKKIHNVKENNNFFSDFNTFVRNYKNVNIVSEFHAFITQYDHLSDLSGNIVINYIGKLENIDNDILNILSILKIENINHDHELFFERKLNKLSDDKINIAFDYNEESFNFVNEHFHKDFELFGYKKYNSLNEFRQEYDERIKKIPKSYENDFKYLSKYDLIENNSISELELENKNIVYDMYKSIIKLRYGLSEEEKFFNKIKDIINIMFLSFNENIKDNDRITINYFNEDILEIIKIKESIIEKNKNEIKRMNTNIFYLLKNYNSVIHNCYKCNLFFYNTTAFNSHMIICKNKLKDSSITLTNG